MITFDNEIKSTNFDLLFCGDSFDLSKRITVTVMPLTPSQTSPSPSLLQQWAKGFKQLLKPTTKNSHKNSHKFGRSVLATYKLDFFSFFFLETRKATARSVSSSCVICRGLWSFLCTSGVEYCLFLFFRCLAFSFYF